MISSLVVMGIFNSQCLLGIYSTLLQNFMISVAFAVIGQLVLTHAVCPDEVQFYLVTYKQLLW